MDIPQTYHGIFDILSKENLINKDEFQKCKKLVVLRNKLSHKYDDIKNEELYELIDMVFVVEKIIAKLIKNVDNN